MADPSGGAWDAETLRALEERLDRAAAAAERLLADAGGGSVPRNGWQRPQADGADEPFGGWLDQADGELLLRLLAGLRDQIPTELQARLVAALHEVLSALRALVDWCLERAQRRRATPAPVQDIPIL